MMMMMMMMVIKWGRRSPPAILIPGFKKPGYLPLAVVDGNSKVAGKDARPTSGLSNSSSLNLAEPYRQFRKAVLHRFLTKFSQFGGCVEG